MQLVREDWKLFRSIETLCQKAGVHREFIPPLVVKELVDNALDATGNCQLEQVDEHSFRVTDDGEGIDPAWLPQYFSINRPMISSKLLRLPLRGALGNGLRVVTGAVIATGGCLTVTTRGNVYQILPQDDGTSIAKEVEKSPHQGTSILVTLGMPVSSNTLSWGKLAIQFSRYGKIYQGKSSPHWYTSEAFYELTNAADMPIETFASLFVAPKKIREWFATYEVVGVSASSLGFAESESLLETIRDVVRPIGSGAIGETGDVFYKYEYAKKPGVFNARSARGRHHAEIPFVVEAWAQIHQDGQTRSSLTVCVNKSPVTADVQVSTKQASSIIWGGGLYIDLKCRPASFMINIITPYMPITSDGKAPDFRPMADLIEDAMKKAASKAKKVTQSEAAGGRNERQIVLDNLERAIEKTSGNGEFIFSQRQLYYAIRPYVMAAFDGKQPDYNYFCRIITDYEAEYGDIPGMYRDPRGTLYHPHTGEEIPLGTIAVKNYERPKWTFNKIIFIEKEGYFASLRDVGFPEKYDCALLSSKGYASRAVKDLFDLLGETEEEIQFFCVHDADAAGTKIFETLQEATSARPGRKVKVINLGLDPIEAVDMGLQVETFESERTRPVADYISGYWADWLQSHRVELNAMTTPEFIEWLEGKLEMYGVGKVIPTRDVLSDALEKSAEATLRDQIIKDILAENQYEHRVRQALDGLRDHIEHSKANLYEKVSAELEHYPSDRWDVSVNRIAKEIVR